MVGIFDYFSGGGRRSRGSPRPQEPVVERKITGSMIVFSLVLGFVVTLTYEEMMTTTKKLECPGDIELQNLLRTVGQYKYYTKLVEAGFDRVDILAESEFNDMKHLPVKPYHWAKMKAEAMSRILKRRVSIIGLLEQEHLGDAARGKTTLADDFLGTDRDTATLATLFVNIEPGEYIPHVTINRPTVTTVCTGDIVSRMIVLLNAVHLANLLESRLHIIWDQNSNCGAKITSLMTFNKRVSISTLSPGRSIADVFVPTSLQEFDAIYTTKASPVIANLLTKEDDYSTASAEAKPIGPESPLVMWASRNIDDLKRTHLLHASEVVSPGVTSDTLKKAAAAFDIRVGTEVNELLRKHLELNEIAADSAFPVFEDHVTDPLPDFLKDRKLILIPVSNFTLSRALFLPSSISSFYNASLPAEESTAMGQFAAASLFASSPVYSTQAIKEEVSSRPESMLSKMLCDANVLKCEATN
eukprot:TRINITY_DN4605_c0_g3_i1.p1 TRINITY_DN4605_c0_g3~~TRINITY_DN4605_c0_g3_i1.p1  ORF type:complete len:490 (+),score=83.24 TRINITY_DN4605_c0_g3_i1:58-1470(+)